MFIKSGSLIQALWMKIMNRLKTHFFDTICLFLNINAICMYIFLWLFLWNQCHFCLIFRDYRNFFLLKSFFKMYYYLFDIQSYSKTHKWKRISIRGSMLTYEIFWSLIRSNGAGVSDLHPKWKLFKIRSTNKRSINVLIDKAEIQRYPFLYLFW